MRSRSVSIFLFTALLLVGAGGAGSAEDRSGLKVPDGLGFAEFKGYEAWEPVGVSQVPDGLKLIAANPVMMAAYRKGLPASGKTFPEGSRIVKIEWAPRPDAASPYPVTVPGQLMSVSFIVKDSKRFPKSHGWAYAQFLYDPATKALRPNGTGSPVWLRLPYGGGGPGLHLHRLPAALSVRRGPRPLKRRSAAHRATLLRLVSWPGVGGLNRPGLR